MKTHQMLIDKRQCIIEYVADTEEMQEILARKGFILELKYFPHESELLTLEKFQQIFKDKEVEIFSEIKFLLNNDIYKSMNFQIQNVTTNSGLNVPQLMQYGNNTIYADSINFGYKHN